MFKKFIGFFLFSGCNATDPYAVSCCNFLPEKCGENEGDCDSHAHCKAGLACGTDNCPPGGFFPPEADCCYIHLGCNATAPYDMSCCNSLPEKCGENEGDCDSDDHCKAGLACGIDNCPAGGNFPPEADCCYKVT